MDVAIVSISRFSVLMISFFIHSDLRPFLLPPQYESHPFKKIDELVMKMETHDAKKKGAG